MKYCPVCGEELNANQNYCSECGTELQKSTPDENEPTSQNSGGFSSASLQTVVLVVGVVIIVAGAGLAIGGYNQMQAAQEWSEQTHYCGTTIGGLDAAQEVDCPDNPYSGGGGKLVSGLLLSVVGGGSVRWGTR